MFPKLTLKRVLIVCGALALLLVLASVGLVLAINPMMKRFIISTIQQRTGLDVKIGELQFKPWSGEFRASEVGLFQPATNGGTLVLKIPELFIAVDQEAAKRNELRVRELRINLSEGIFPARFPNGKTLEDLETEWPRPPTNQPPLVFGGIDRLTLSIGKFTFPDPVEAGEVRSINFNLQSQTFTNVTTTNLESIIYYIGIRAGAGTLLESMGNGLR